MSPGHRFLKRAILVRYRAILQIYERLFAVSHAIKSL
jgi:hypothetical protein